MSQPNGNHHVGPLDVVVEEVAARGTLSTSPPCQIAIQLRVRLDPCEVAEATPAPPILAGPHPLRTAREEAVVGLLTRGYTDETIARTLGLSKRTVSYTISGLMRRLGAGNRFQLAWILGRASGAPPRSQA
jgi:DNA-binding NarL/FixJ family response regulator